MGSSEETFLKLEAVNSTVGYNYCEVAGRLELSKVQIPVVPVLSVYTEQCSFT